jgi:hypothetical protein
LPLQGSSSSTWENLQRDISKIAFDIPTYKVASWCLRTGVTIRSRNFFFSCSGFVSAGLFVVLPTYDLGSLCARNTDRRTDLETAFRGDFFLSGFICRCLAWLGIWKCCGSASSIAVCAKLLIRPIEEIFSCEDPCCAVWLYYGSEIGVAMHPVWRFVRSFSFLTRFCHGVCGAWRFS